jgi:HK97 family phage major capsid protein
MTRSRDQQPRDGRSWYRITAQADSPAQIMLYDLIGMWGVTAKDFISDLAALSGPVEVHINSDGGDCFEAFAIYGALLARPGVTTIVDSVAASAASVIAMAGERRLMARTSQMMLHDAWAGIDGNADDLQHMTDRLNVMSGQLAGIYADTAGGTPDHWRAVMKAETWFTPEQALDAGLITGISGTARVPAAAAAASGAASPGVIRAAASATVAAAWDPDGDGDDDSAPGTDTDHSHWAPDGTQKKSVPGKPMPGQPPAPDAAAAGPVVAWDGPAAMSAASASSDPAAALAAICAGRREGDPKTQAAYALPHHAHPGDPPDPAGTRNALSRLPQTQGLINEAAAKAHLEAHMKTISPGDQAPASAVQSTGRNGMDDAQGALTIEGRRTRITDIGGRLTDMAAGRPAAVFPPDEQAEWDQLVAEKRDHEAALAAVEARNAVLADIHGASGNSHDRPRAQGNGSPQGQGAPSQRFGAPAQHVSRDIYDLGAIRQQASRPEDLPGLYRDNALRAIEQHRFPGSPSREAAQTAVEKLLDQVTDDRYGELPRRILATGSPAYTRVFGHALRVGNPGMLTGQDSQILALGESPDTAGGFAVPFQLDPTIVLTSSGGVSPLRDIARIEKIVGKEYDLVTSAGVTVHRVAEAATSSDDSPVLAQPTVRAERVQGFVPFSVELQGDWNALQSQMLGLLSDAKALEEADAGGATTGFILGTGVAPQAGGIITTMPGVAGGSGGSSVRTTTALTFALADIFKLKNAVGNRFRPRGQWMANSAIYDLCRQFGTSIANIWAESLQVGVPSKLIGYPVNESSAMSVATGVTLSPILIFGAFDQYLIVDAVGMNMELIPQLVQQVTAGTGPARPTGQRGYYSWWRNNAVIVNPNAFRVLQP